MSAPAAAAVKRRREDGAAADAAAAAAQVAANSPGSCLAPRAAAALKPALSYGAAFVKLKDLGLWSPENPDGSIVLGVAENRISADVLHDRISQLGPFPPTLMTYQAWRGIPELGQALTALLESTFMAGVDVSVDHLTCTAGAGAIVDSLFHCITSEGDGVLIPAPYYPAFDNDLSVRNGAVAIPVHLATPSGSLGAKPPSPHAAAASDGGGGDGNGGVSGTGQGAPSGGGGSGGRSLAEQLDAAVAAARRPVRALLLSNPSNPLGTVVPEEEMREMMAWCLSRSIHFVSDEIYALSVFGSDGPEFVSAAQLAVREAAAMPGGDRADDLVHVIFGASKDFCASGLRLGCLWSRNARLNEALVNLAYFTLPAAPVQWYFAQLMGDAAFVGRYLKENRRRLARSYAALTGALSALPEPRIPYLPATAAMFLWIDLSGALREPTWEEEDALWARLVEAHRVLLTPGRACHAAAPGFFRICWAWMPAEALPVAVERIAAAAREHKAGGGAALG